jgi:TRAP-type C4-dicarboxylate transport system permease small subunit
MSKRPGRRSEMADMPDDKMPSKRKQVEELIFLKIPHVVAGTLFVIAVIINIFNVIARYVFSSPVFWAEEILVFIIIWTVFLVAGSITYRGAHLNMDLLYSGMSRPWKLVVNTAIVVTMIGCAVFAAMESWKIVVLHIRNNGVTAATDIPLAIPISALLFGFSFMALAAIVRFRAYVAGEFD